MTLKLYLEDSYLISFTAEVVEIIRSDNKFGVILDQTAFYPSAGGQACDLGFLNSARVIDVQKDGDERIIHYLDGDTFNVGDSVCGKIDGDRRAEFMRKHTGQHILSRAFVETSEADTVGAHLGDKESTIELNNENLSSDDLRKAELLANQIILENRKISYKMVPTTELRNYNLRKLPDRDGIFRLVIIDDYDVNACAGTHLSTTGGVGLIKITGQEKIRGHLRITFAAGLTALSDYCDKHDALIELSHSLTCHYSDLKSTIVRLGESNSDYRKEITRLNKELRPVEIQKLIASSKVVNGARIISYIYDNKAFKEIQALANELKRHDDLAIILSDGEKLLIAVSDNLPVHCGEIVKRLITEIGGRGGGNDKMAQLGSLDKARIENIMKTTAGLIVNEISGA